MEIQQDATFMEWARQIAEAFKDAKLPKPPTPQEIALRVMRLLDSQCFELASDEIERLRRAGEHEIADQLQKELARAKALAH